MTYGINGNTDSFFDYFNTLDDSEDSVEARMSDESLTSFLNKAVLKVIQEGYKIDAIERGFDQIFEVLDSCIDTLTLERVIEVIEGYMKVTQYANLNDHCKQLMLSHFMDFNFKLQNSLSESQAQEYPKKKEWQEYFSKLNQLFNVQAEEWEKMCFNYIEQQTQIPLYTFSLFTAQLDALTFLVMAGKKGAVWNDYEIYYDKLMEKFLDQLIGSEFGGRAINEYALVKNGRELSVSMAGVVSKYLRMSCISAFKAFEFVHILISNRAMTTNSYAVIIRTIINKVPYHKAYSILQYKKLLSLFILLPDKEDREAVWVILQKEISIVLRRYFEVDCDTKSFMKLKKVKGPVEFLECKGEFQKEIDLWLFIENIDRDVNNNANSYIRYIAACLSAHLRYLNPKQTCELLNIIEHFVQARKVGGLAQKSILSAVLGAIEIERKRSEGKTEVIIKFCEKHSLINIDYLPLLIKDGGNLLRDVAQAGHYLHPMIHVISRLLKLSKSEIMLRLAPGIIRTLGFQTLVSEIFEGTWGKHELTPKDLIIMKEVIQSSKLSKAAFALKLYFGVFNIPKESIRDLTEQILDSALVKKSLSYDEIKKILEMLVTLPVRDQKDGFLNILDPKIVTLLKHKFSLWELVQINQGSDSTFSFRHYGNLFSLHLNVIDRYGINKDQILPLINQNWFLEVIRGLNKLKYLGKRELEEKRTQVIRRVIGRRDLVLLELELSEIKKQLLRVVVRSYAALGTHSDWDKMLVRFIDQGYYEKPMHDECCVSFENKKLILKRASHSK